MTLPNYVDFGGGQDLVQPYVMKGVRFYGFLVKCRQDAIQNLLDTRLNAPSSNQFGYGAAFSHILVAFTVTEKASPQGDMGYIEETDVAFWYPSYAWNPFRLRWFLPYVFVDSSYAVVSGREVYGFPKANGTYRIPKLSEDPDLFTADSIAFMGPNQQAVSTRLFEVSRKNTQHQEGHRDFTGVAEMWQDIQGKIFDGKSKIHLPVGPAISAAEHMFSNKVPFVFLKQFRDVQNPKKACYQSIVEADATLDRFETGGWLPGQYQLKLNSPGNFPLSKDLGIDEGGVDVDFSFFCKFDFTMQTGKEIWNAND
jgi:hypothetical protein